MAPIVKKNIEDYCQNCTQMNSEHCRCCLQDILKGIGIDVNKIVTYQRPASYEAQKKPDYESPR